MHAANGDIQEEEEDEDNISEEEVSRALKKLKRGKAPGADGIQNEAWIYGEELIVGELTEILGQVWESGRGTAYQKNGRRAQSHHCIRKEIKKTAKTTEG